MLKMSLTVFYFEYKLIDICYEVQALWCTKTKRSLFFQYEWWRRHCESVNQTLIYGYINVHLETKYAPYFFSKYTSFYINDFKKPFILFLYLFAFFPLKKCLLTFYAKFPPTGTRVQIIKLNRKTRVSLKVLNICAVNRIGCCFSNTNFFPYLS